MIGISLITCNQRLEFICIVLTQLFDSVRTLHAPHDAAVLSCDAPALGIAGTLVNIWRLEGLYATTELANASATYHCADPACGVKVSAVIVVKDKEGRKRSPSSYFSAKPHGHVGGCSRQPAESQSANPPEHETLTAQPHRLNAPVVWNDPEVKRMLSPVQPTVTLLGGGSRSGGHGGVTVLGNGVSSTSTQKLENLALAWLHMRDDHQRLETKLAAPWNPLGSYFSAFRPLHLMARQPVHELGKRVFVGTLSVVNLIPTGFWLELLESHKDQRVLAFWVKREALAAHADGEALRQQLISLAGRDFGTSVGVYALGQFYLQEPKASNKTWYSLSVSHPHNIWIHQS